MPDARGANGAAQVYNFKVYFQRTPGKAGDPIVGAPYRLRYAATGRTIEAVTQADGGTQTIQMTAGEDVYLSFCGFEYKLKPHVTMEAKNLNTGMQRRLQMLGYYDSNIDGDLQVKSNEAVAQFEADYCDESYGVLRVNAAGTTTEYGAPATTTDKIASEAGI